MSKIRFEAKIFKVSSWTLLTLPKSASAKLPSRGMVVVEGTINDFPFQAALEPDGKRSHWLKVDKTMSKAINAVAGDTVKLVIEPIKEWPEPKVPTDFKKALTSAAKAQATWKDITPNARWDWVRWIGATKNLETRKKRIGVALSKMKAGNRRPCCFNRNACSEPSVSSNGVLLEPTTETKIK